MVSHEIGYRENELQDCTQKMPTEAPAECRIPESGLGLGMAQHAFKTGRPLYQSS